jgi:hypothetical protein
MVLYGHLHADLRLFCILWSFGFDPIFNTNYPIFRWQFPWFIFPLLFPRVLTSGRHISTGSTTSKDLTY